MEMIGRLKERIEQGYRLGYDEALELLRTTPETELCALAHALRTRYQGKTIDMCSIMNVEVYPLVGAREAVEEAAGNARKGVKRFSLVTSGRTLSDADTDRICAIYRRIGSEVSVSLCASLGLLNLEQMRRLKESGVRRYHCNLETAPSYFPKLCSTHTVAEKLRTIGWAREAGLEICSGGIIGMGESEEQRVEFAIALRQTGAVSIPVNVLNPIPGTRLAGAPPLTDSEIVRAVAVMRILNPEAAIRLAGGRTRIKHLEERLLQCGVSALIVGDMLTTTGSDIETDKRMFIRCGFEV